MLWRNLPLRWLCAGSLLAGCATSPRLWASGDAAGTVVDPPPADTPASEAPPDAPAELVWSFTTRIEEAPDRAQAMVGTGGHYELVVDGVPPTRGSLRRVGADGKAIPQGQQTAVEVTIEVTPVRDDEVPADAWAKGWVPLEVTDLELWRISADVTIDGKPQPIAFEIHRSGNKLAGAFVYGGTFLDKTEPDVELETLFGRLVGGRYPSDLSVITDSTPMPCVVACDATSRCGGQGPGTCNGSLMCRDACFGLGG